MSQTELLAPDTGEVAAVSPPPSGRLASLDVFRGITIAGMLLVNNPGSWAAVYPPLRHAEWHGLTPTDLIFPYFLFIVGVSMTFSFAKTTRNGAEAMEVFRRAAVRALVLIALGLVLHSFPWVGYDFSRLRIPGVLQRIGLAFLLATPLVLWMGTRRRAAATAVLLFGYWAVMRLVPVPGHGAGSLEPGADPGAYLDRLVFGTDHLWSQSRTWDPEGLLSTLPAVATVLLGSFAGDWLRSGRPPRELVRGLLLSGVSALAAGLLWHPLFPINKPLWTSSYVVFTAGAALVTLAACYWVIDVKGRRRWAFPFLVFGVNAIAAFFLSSLGARLLTMVTMGDTTLKGWLYRELFASWLTPLDASLAFALAYVVAWMAVMWAMYRRGVFIKV